MTEEIKKGLPLASEYSLKPIAGLYVLSMMITWHRLHYASHESR